MKGKVLKAVKDYLDMTFAVLLVTICWECFMIPNGMSAGGLMGLCAVIEYATGGIIIASYSYFVINLALIVLAVLAFIFLKGIINKKENHYFDLKNGNDVIPFKTKVKTTASSPTLITFAAIMTLYCVLVLFIGV